MNALDMSGETGAVTECLSAGIVVTHVGLTQIVDGVDMRLCESERERE